MGNLVERLRGEEDWSREKVEVRTFIYSLKEALRNPFSETEAARINRIATWLELYTGDQQDLTLLFNNLVDGAIAIEVVESTCFLNESTYYTLDEVHTVLGI